MFNAKLHTKLLTIRKNLQFQWKAKPYEKNKHQLFGLVTYWEWPPGLSWGSQALPPWRAGLPPLSVGLSRSLGSAVQTSYPSYWGPWQWWNALWVGLPADGTRFSYEWLCRPGYSYLKYQNQMFRYRKCTLKYWYKYS